MLGNGSLRNCCDPGGRGRFGLAEREAAGAPRPAWVVAVLSSVLIFTTVVDILGNLLVVVSVFKNRKLRNSGTPRHPVPGAPLAQGPGAARSPRFVLPGAGGSAGRQLATGAPCSPCGATDEANRCYLVNVPETEPETVGGRKKKL
ncbi:melatonin receptor type 1B isoform X2 [Falco naumanni]|uniref:melatonin receptor type 1B isoform X2 n=1 Tax=Falco naumanni TaxID=148594 RepID=UPI001ADDF388|nr:melatonin receptor type 1B isoform X2 [Falco naumanni]